jgi:hypothetical protein
MSSRLALLAPLIAGLAIGSPAPHAAPAAMRFRIDAKTHAMIDLTGFGQPPTEQDIGLTAWVGITLSDTTGGRTMHVVVDSAKYEGTVPISQESVDSVKGGVLHGLVEPNGRVKDLNATPKSSLFMAQVQAVMANLFPKLKGAAKTGDTWTDTSEVTNTAGGANTTTKLISTYTAGSNETVAGLPAMRLNASFTSSTTGTLENPMGTVEVEGTGTGTGYYLVGADGRYLGSGSTTNLDQKLKTAMAPGPIPVKTVQTLTVTLLK